MCCPTSTFSTKGNFRFGVISMDKFVLGGHEFTSRFIIGSGKYSLELIKAAVEQA